MLPESRFDIVIIDGAVIFVYAARFSSSSYTYTFPLFSTTIGTYICIICTCSMHAAFALLSN